MNMPSYYDSYIGTSSQERQEMLAEMGYNDIMELFSEVPQELLLDKPIDILGPLSEAELSKLFKKIANKNESTLLSFLGGGVRQQYIPAALEELMHRGELYTAYTPYQPEISQGMLQLIYEYQSMIAELFGVEVVNASLYDWGTALGEAILIMTRITRRSKIIIAGPVSPKRIEVAKSYLLHSGIELEILSGTNGNVPTEELIHLLHEEAARDKKERNIAGIYIEIPTYYGTLPNYPENLSNAVHEADCLLTVGVDPISLGILSPPGEYDADLVIGEGQLLGNAPSSGGPLLGILAAKFDKKWIRQLPGRLIGATTELDSELPGYCITLQTREQHIRREKATSNICTNQSITAVNAGIYLASLGKEGIKELSQGLFDRAHYLASEMNKLSNVKAPLYEPFYAEFITEFTGISHTDLEQACLAKGVIPGIAIEGDSCLRLISVSELHCKNDLDTFVSVLKEVVS
ncbi:MAG: aminomethyl-transferring glycine dehydrogenase subunit GcvPA [Candidatus Kariarchaeaceae archaeon]|jgi:glycine dehydrogenase subunit 1